MGVSPGDDPHTEGPEAPWENLSGRELTTPYNQCTYLMCTVLGDTNGASFGTQIKIK